MQLASDVMEKASTNAQQTSEEIGELRKQTIRTAEQTHGVLLVTGRILEWMKEVQARHEKEDQIDTNFIIVSPEGHRVWRNNQKTNYTEQLFDVKE